MCRAHIAFCAALLCSRGNKEKRSGRTRWLRARRRQAAAGFMPSHARTGSSATPRRSSIRPGRFVDPHHHLWDRTGQQLHAERYYRRYRLGHNVVATVYVDCRSMYRADGTARMKPVGEVEFANGVAAQSASGAYGKAKLSMPASSVTPTCCSAATRARCWRPRSRPAMAASRASVIRRRGTPIRRWPGMYAQRPKNLLLDETFRKGFACLAPLGLTFDAWLFHPQLERADGSRKKIPEPEDHPRSLWRLHWPRQLQEQA